MPKPTNIDDNKQYTVEMAQVVKLNEHVILTPGTQTVLKGKILKTLTDEAVQSGVELA